MVVLMVADQRLLDFKVVQQFDGNAGVFRCDKIYSFQSFHGAGRKVAQITDGGSDQIESTAHGVSSCFVLK